MVMKAAFVRLLLIMLLSATGIAANANELPVSTPPTNTPTQSIKLTLPATLPEASFDNTMPVVVVVDKQNHITYALQLRTTEDGGQEVVSVLAIPNANGKRSTPTPTGRTFVKVKTLDPTWIPPKSIDPAQRPVGPYSKTHHNPLGVAWIGLDLGSIGLHGTNTPSSIGKSVSHGCVRHHNEDILKLYDLVKPKTVVYLVHHLAGTEIKLSDFQPNGT